MAQTIRKICVFKLVSQIIYCPIVSSPTNILNHSFRLIYPLYELCEVGVSILKSDRISQIRFLRTKTRILKITMDYDLLF